MRRVASWWSAERGNVAPLLAIMIVPIIGAFAIAGETGSWYTLHRAQQNAADSAALAAALKKSTSEGTSVATAYGYTTNATTVTVNSTSPGTCPTGALAGTTCYKVTITRKVPIYLTRVAGYNGDATIGTAKAKSIAASAIAGQVAGNNNFCLIGLTSLTLNGGPSTDLTGCQLLSGGSMACNGTSSDTGVVDGFATGSNQNCGTNSVSNYTAFSGDPESSTVTTNISSLCSGGYTTVTTLPTLSSGTNCFNANGGTISMTASQTVNNANTIIVIKNGGLNIQGGVTLNTAGTGSLTVVWTGATGANPVLQSSGGSGGATLNIAAPTTGSWKGMALIEDPALTGQRITIPHVGNMNSRDFNFSGGSNTITLDISGLIYLPNAEFDLTGSIDHASNGYRCIGIIANTIVASGTNSIFANPTLECRQAGLTLPTVPMVALLQ